MDGEKEKTEKVTMKESELTALIEDKTKAALAEFAEKEVAEKVDILLEVLHGHDVTVPDCGD